MGVVFIILGVKKRLIWFVQLLVNEYVMLKLLFYLCSFLPFEVENGWTIVLFLALGAIFTKVLQDN